MKGRSKIARAITRIPALLAPTLLGFACSTPPEIYTLPSGHHIDQQREVPADYQQFESGRPNWFFDGLNHYLFSLPTKLLLWNWQLLDHELPDEHELLLKDYLALNSMYSVKIRHNQYNPIGEFQRLRANTEVAWGYRYTLGLFTWLQYTLFPQRVFAGLPIIGVGDNFNPFTNTISVYSSDSGVLLHEAGHAKDYLQHDYRGTTFAAFRLIPFVDLFQERTASLDATRYLYCIRDTQRELRAYKTLIPAYSTYLAGYIGGGLVVTVPVVATGHLTGRLRARAREWAIEHPELDRSGHSHADYLPDYCLGNEAVEDSFYE